MDGNKFEKIVGNEFDAVKKFSKIGGENRYYSFTNLLWPTRFSVLLLKT